MPFAMLEAIEQNPRISGNIVMYAPINRDERDASDF